MINSKLIKKHADEVKFVHNKTIGIANKPCKECQSMMAKGFLLIGADVSKTTDENAKPDIVNASYYKL